MAEASAAGTVRAQPGASRTRPSALAAAEAAIMLPRLRDDDTADMTFSFQLIVEW
jgi:hypothetical protein